jgi:hypothetical protein
MRSILAPTMRAVLLATAAAAAANDSAWQWRERVGLAGSACPAECPLRHRSIVNIKDFGRAGFADRQFIIEGVTIMAVSLCARVVLPMPEESFGGHDMRVGKEMQWKHLFELRDATGAPVLENKHIIGEVEASMNVTSFETFETKDAVAALRRAKSIRDAGGYFVWRIRGEFWDWYRPLQEEARNLGLAWRKFGGHGPLGEAYGPLPLAPPPCVLGVAPYISKVVRKAADLVGGAFDSLHLRRGDAKDSCGTDVKRDVKPFLNCVAPLLRAPTVLVFTDEKSHSYQRDVYALDSLRGKARDGDALVRQAIAASGDDHGVYNLKHGHEALITYYVGRQLQGLADTRLEMRRYVCRLSVLGRWAAVLPSEEKTYVNDLATTCRGRKRL